VIEDYYFFCSFKLPQIRYYYKTHTFTFNKLN